MILYHSHLRVFVKHVTIFSQLRGSFIIDTIFKRKNGSKQSIEIQAVWYMYHLNRYVTK